MPPAPAVIVLAAGKGERLAAGGPKVLAEANGWPLLAHVLQTAAALKPRELVVVVPPRAPDELTELLARYGARPAVQERPRGTADAVRAALAALRLRAGPAVILMGDVPLLRPKSLRALLARHRRTRARVTALTFAPADPSGYGRLLRDEQGRALRIAEHRDLSARERSRWGECNTGTWAAELGWLGENLGRLEAKNAAGELYLTDLFARAARGGRAQSLLLAEASEGLGVNTPAELARAEALLRARKGRELLARGVLLTDPERTYIEQGVRVGRGTRIEPGALLTGATCVGASCRVGAGAIIADSALAAGAQVLAYSVIEQSRIEAGARVGPLAHLRPGSRVGRGARVGNFVELKKASLGAGAKAGHLSYLGDARVGEGVNVGAGTITCNYDGARKHETRIGTGAFIGSGTQLVAPLTVGPGAYVGAGTTLTHDVPAGALALSRVEQRVVPGWASRQRGKKRPARKKPKRKRAKKGAPR